MLRVLLAEPEALPLRDLSPACTSALSLIECNRVLDRYRLLGDLTGPILYTRLESAGRLLETVELISISDLVLNRAAYPLPVPLGTLDAIHLATALVWMERGREPVTFATHDEGLARAAREMHLPVIGVPASR